MRLGKLRLRCLELGIQTLNDFLVLNLRSLHRLDVLEQLGIQVAFLLLKLLSQALVLIELLLKLMALVLELHQHCVLFGDLLHLVDQARDHVKLGPHSLPCHLFAHDTDQFLVLRLQGRYLTLQSKEGLLTRLLNFGELHSELLDFCLLDHDDLLVLALIGGHRLAHLVLLVLDLGLVVELELELLVLILLLHLVLDLLQLFDRLLDFLVGAILLSFGFFGLAGDGLLLRFDLGLELGDFALELELSLGSVALLDLDCFLKSGDLRP